MPLPKPPWTDHRELHLEPMEVHLAHFRGDLHGRNDVPPRVNANWQMLYPRFGHRFRCSVGEYRSAGACLYLIPPGFPYAMHLERYTHYSVHFSSQRYRGYEDMRHSHRPCSDAAWRRGQLALDLVGLTLLDRSWPLVQPIGDAPELLFSFHALIDNYNRNERFAASASLYQLLLALSVSARQDTLAARIKPFADYLAFHCHEPCSLSELARQCSLSRSQLHRLVKSHYGHAPKELILREKMHLACQILERETSVTAAAAAVGFTDEYYFSRLFKSRMGITPSAWAKRLGAP